MIGRARKKPMLTFKVLGALLAYPEPDWIAHLDEMEAILDREGLLRRRDREPLGRLAEQLRRRDLLDAQASYVSLFDQSRALSLYLFEHIHGDSRERGQAMHDLAEHYRAHGLEPSGAELPDYLPLLLEFLSTRPLEEARAMLGEVVDVLALLRARLERRGAPYAAALRAIESLSPRRASSAALDEKLAADKPDDTPAALDASWAERPITFGPGGALGENRGGAHRGGDAEDPRIRIEHIGPARGRGR